VAEIQNYVREKYNYKLNYDGGKPDELAKFAHEKMFKFTENMVGYFMEAVNRYTNSQNQKGRKPKDVWVLFVVEDSERNVMD
jgi:hypothetical protein